MATVADSVAGEAWRTMQRLFFDGLGHDMMAKACAEAGTPPAAVKALIHLSPTTPTPMRDIANHFGIDASYVTALVDDLEEQGLAERRPHPTDRRVKTVVLTDAGVDAQHRINEVMGTPPPCFKALSATETRQLRDMLLKLAAADPRLAAGAGVEHRSA